MPGNQAFTFIGQENFSGQAGQLRFGFSGGDTLLLGDTNGDIRADLEIVLTGFNFLIGDYFVL